VSTLEEIDFGLGAAQQEQQLKNYFYRSGSFKLASSDKTYLILGAKGAGKSAIFQMLQELHKEISVFRSPNIWIADEPQLRDHWATLKSIGVIHIKNFEDLTPEHAAKLSEWLRLLQNQISQSEIHVE
jgi:ABC-type multidrug transport system ATPase subunit